MPISRETFDGGCVCGATRFRLTRAPLFVHCCHCTRCQRATGAPFAQNALIEFTAMKILSGSHMFTRAPTDSGSAHWIARCEMCQGGMWNEHGSRRAITRYVRVGAFDYPALCPPQAHIYVKSKQDWLTLDPATPAFQRHYTAARLWPAESLKRYAAAKAERRSRGE